MPIIIAYKARWETVEKVPKGSLEEPEEAVDDIPVNLSPFFSHGKPASGNSDEYWKNLSLILEPLDDGWCHVSMDNSNGSSTMNSYYRVKRQPFVKPSSHYTFLLEFRNVEIAASAFYASVTSSSSGYVHPWTTGPSVAVNEGAFMLAVRSKDDLASADSLVYGRHQVGAGKKSEFDVRMSLYETELSEVPSAGLEIGTIASGNNASGSTRFRTAGSVPVSGGDTYVFDCISDAGMQVGVHQMAADGSFLNDSGWKSVPYSAKMLADAVAARLVFRRTDNASVEYLFDGTGGVPHVFHGPAYNGPYVPFVQSRLDALMAGGE